MEGVFQETVRVNFRGRVLIKAVSFPFLDSGFITSIQVFAAQDYIPIIIGRNLALTPITWYR
jgi:hypothetical protein